MFDFLCRVCKKAGEKVVKDIKAVGTNTGDAFSAAQKGDKEKLEQLSDKFLENAAAGCLAIAAKKAGLGAVTAVIDGGDVADAVGDALGHVNPVVMSVVVFNAVMAGVCKITADKKLQDQIVSVITGDMAKRTELSGQYRRALLRGDTAEAARLEKLL